MIGVPPLNAGAVNATVAWLLPGVATPIAGAPGTTAISVKLRVTFGAALKVPLPDCEALMVHSPAEISVALLPDTLHTAGVSLAKATVSDEVAVAVRDTAAAAKFWLAGPSKLMVWFTLTTVRVKFCVASGAVALVALMVTGQVPAVPDAGVPDSTPLPALKLTPNGRPPASDSVGDGVPVRVTVKLPALPTVKVVPAALVICGATPGSCGVTLAEAEAAPVPAGLVAVTEHE